MNLSYPMQFKIFVLITLTIQFSFSTFITYNIPTHQSILDFWTPERIANAKPYIPQPPRILKSMHIPNEKKSIAKVEPISPTNHTVFPFSAFGRLLFTNSRNVPMYCGAVSTGGNAVFTAGQCVSDGYVKLFANG